MKVIWGGKIETNGLRHSQERAMKRNISLAQIEAALAVPDETEIQSLDCRRYVKQFDERHLRIVAVNKGNDVYEIITCFWED